MPDHPKPNVFAPEFLEQAFERETPPIAGGCCRAAGTGPSRGVPGPLAGRFPLHGAWIPGAPPAAAHRCAENPEIP